VESSNKDHKAKGYTKVFMNRNEQKMEISIKRALEIG
jgi:hypothetical protein